MLLTERVYGAQAVVYHGSETAPDVFIPALLNDDFEPGGRGASHGKGLYCVYDLVKTQTGSGKYGNYVYKFKVNLYGFICFDPEVALLVYKLPLTPVEQAQELGLDETLIEKLKAIRIRDGFTSDAALPASEFLNGKVKGLIFTSTKDGKVAVIYDSAAAVPFAWKQVDDKTWNSIDKSSLKPALRKSALGDWETKKYEIETLLAKLSKLPADKRIIKGDLDLSDSSITSLPAGLKVGGALNLSGSKITSLPADLKVDDNLYLNNTSITSLPVGLKVGGSLYLNNTSITSLPADLKVGGNLNLSATNIISLPAGLKVGGDLGLGHTKITSLPADLKVGGTLGLSYSSITLLPAGLKVGGTLGLSNTKITSLPAGLKVGRDLILFDTSITSLPADLKVGGGIYGFTGDASQVPPHLMDKLR